MSSILSILFRPNNNKINREIESSLVACLSFSLMFQLNHDLEQDDIRSFRHNQAGSPIANSPPGKSLSAELIL